jgi:hypothetical protein
VASIFPKWTNKIPLAIAAGTPVVLIGIIGAVWYYFSPSFTDVGYQPNQPVPFSHQLHAGQLGMDCRYCHNTVEKAAHAAVPPTETCMGCHSQVRKTSPLLAVVRESYATDRSIPWSKIHMLPEHAHFDHSVHVGGGVGCVECHGRVDQMVKVYQTQPLSMSWCLDCHRNPSPRLRPKTEVTNMSYDARAAGYDPSTDPHRNRMVAPPEHCGACHY